MTSNSNNDSSPKTEQDKLVKHWFYEKIVDGKKKWAAFSYIDSANIEEAYLKSEKYDAPVTTDGGE
jgi:hypothetical protein